MDPLSQATIGAAAAQSVIKKADLARIGLIGALAGMAPDLDVLIQSSTDPLLQLEYHRQFTHSLVFVPFGALLCAMAFWPFVRRHMSFKAIWLTALAGYATHGLLDACTTYGTLLLWPFSDARIAWNTISVVDPLFTLPLLGFVIVAGVKKSQLIGQLGMAWVAFYLSIGIIQEERARTAGEALVAQRGHAPALVSAKPSFGNLLLWKQCMNMTVNSGSTPCERVVTSPSSRETMYSVLISQQRFHGSTQSLSKRETWSVFGGFQMTIWR